MPACARFNLQVYVSTVCFMYSVGQTITLDFKLLYEQCVCVNVHA